MTIIKYKMGSVQPDRQEQTVSAVQSLGEMIVSNCPYFIIITDAKGLVVFVNHAAEKALGQPTKDVRGRPISDLLQPAQSTVPSTTASNCAQPAGAWKGDFHANLPDGSQIVVEMTVGNFKGDGLDGRDDVLSIYMGRDVTEERNLQRRAIHQERSAARGEMAAEVAHELNNYLSVVCGNLELLTLALERGDHGNVQARIRPMKDGLNRIARFVEGLMSIPGPGTKKEITDINQFLKGELAFFKSQALFEGIKFTCQWGANIPPIEVDSAQFRQALSNILDNAAQALSAVPPGKKEVMLSTTYSASDHRIQLTISDNGCGMCDEDLGRIFRQHFTTKNRGHGFGLLAVKRAVKAHGGRITASRRPEGGTSFTIELPCPAPVPSNIATVAQSQV